MFSYLYTKGDKWGRKIEKDTRIISNSESNRNDYFQSYQTDVYCNNKTVTEL